MKALFVYAHPDDETFATAGTIAKLAKDGVTVQLICATRGEKGQTGNPSICSQEELGKFREEELRSAAEILGIKDIFFLGLIDGTLKDVSEDELTTPILSIMHKEMPDIIITFDINGGESAHSDHQSISKSTTFAFEQYAKDAKKHVRLYYRVTPHSFEEKLEKEGLLHEPFGKKGDRVHFSYTTAVNISETLAVKTKAAEVHKSQHEDWERILLRKKFKEFNFEYFQLISENRLA